MVRLTDKRLFNKVILVDKGFGDYYAGRFYEFQYLDTMSVRILRHVRVETGFGIEANMLGGLDGEYMEIVKQKQEKESQ